MHGLRRPLLVLSALLAVLVGLAFAQPPRQAGPVAPRLGRAAALAQEALPLGSSADLAQRLASTPLPGRDPIELATRLRGLTPAAPRAPSGPLDVGREESFWILDQRTAQLFQARATLRLVTEHAYWFVETALADRAPQADLERSATVFETRTYPLIHRYFGSEPSPGVDGDPRIVLLLGNVPGVAAYFSSADAYTAEVNPRSNEREMIYVNLNALRPGQQAFDSTVVHELQHMANFARCPNQEGWVDEGASELAMRVAGYEAGPPQAFATQPSIQLTGWGQQPMDVSRHYQAAYLFLRYVAERAGGWDALPGLLESCARGEALFSDFLGQVPLSPDVESLVADWAVANVLQDPSVGDGRFGYAGGGFHAAPTGTVGRGAPFQTEAPQYAASYLELPTGGGSGVFGGAPEVPLFAGWDSGGAWWSNRGDSLDTRLTRRIDLTGLTDATLRFRAWYDLEDQFDFGYLTASRDGGATWQVLNGLHTEHDRATGNNFGAGWTGASGAWVDEEVDLTPLVGGEVLLRFEYLTDQSYNRQGFAVRDFQIAQLGELAALDEGWTPEGWLWVDAPLPERWNVRLVRWTPSGSVVDTVDVAADGSAAFTLDDAATRNVLVVLPTAPRTLVPASFSVTVGDATS